MKRLTLFHVLNAHTFLLFRCSPAGHCSAQPSREDECRGSRRLQTRQDLSGYRLRHSRVGQAERRRETEAKLETMGALLERAAVGHGQRGLLGGWQLVGGERARVV